MTICDLIQQAHNNYDVLQYILRVCDTRLGPPFALELCFRSVYILLIQKRECVVLGYPTRVQGG